jgi:hypothetical protein
MNATDPIDAGRLSLALHDLRLPAIKLVWPHLAVRADKEGWPAARFLAALAEHEIAERANRRMAAASSVLAVSASRSLSAPSRAASAFWRHCSSLKMG